MFDIDKMHAIRTEKRISRTKLSNLSGVPKETIESWEMHYANPVRINDLNNIAIVLDCYLDDFLEDGKYFP
jgi:DNA-binding Xre family transcriptional regulator